MMLVPNSGHRSMTTRAGTRTIATNAHNKRVCSTYPDANPNNINASSGAANDLSGSVSDFNLSLPVFVQRARRPVNALRRRQATMVRYSSSTTSGHRLPDHVRSLPASIQASSWVRVCPSSPNSIRAWGKANVNRQLKIARNRGTLITSGKLSAMFSFFLQKAKVAAHVAIPSTAAKYLLGDPNACSANSPSEPAVTKT